MYIHRKVATLLLTIVMSFQLVQTNTASAEKNNFIIDNNSLFDINSMTAQEKIEQSARADLIDALQSITKKQGIGGSFKNPYSIAAAVNLLTSELSDEIDLQSRESFVPKEMIAAVLFREIISYDIFDKYLDGSISKTIGISQISAEGLKQDDKIVSEKENVSPKYGDYSDNVLNKMLTNDYLSVGFVITALKARAYHENISFNTTDETEIEKIFADYNDFSGQIPFVTTLSEKIGLEVRLPELGFVQYKGTYGKQSYKYYQKFVEYYKKIQD